MNIPSRTACALSTALLALNAAAFDWTDAAKLIPTGSQKEPAPTHAAAVPASAQDRKLERQLNVFLGEPPVATAGDRQCETVVALDPLDVIKNATTNTLNTDSVGTAIAGIIKGEGINTDKAKAKALEVLKQELKRQVWMPLAIEEMSGKEMLAQRENVIKDNEPPAKAALKKVEPIFKSLVSTTAGVQPYTPTLHIFTDDSGQPQAETLPGGIILINLTLAQSDKDRITGYLAHELGHVVKRHQTMALQANLIDSVKTIQEIRDMFETADGRLLELVMKGINLRGLAFTRYYSNQELEADGCGAKFLASNQGREGLTPIEKFLEDIEASTAEAPAENPKEASPPLFQELHPTYTERRQTLEKSFQHWLSAATAAR